MNSLKAKKGLGNIVTGLFNQLVTIALGILIPRLILTSLGSEANGLLSSVNQVLAYLALLEAGIGTASMQRGLPRGRLPWSFCSAGFRVPSTICSRASCACFCWRTARNTF